MKLIKNPKVLTFVLAGGEGSRLHPLTNEHSKPSLPFGGRHRIVDFVLSNLINSGIHAIYMLVQYKSQSLIEHVRKAWVVSPTLPHQFVSVVPPQMHGGTAWFQGTSDAVYQNLNLIYEHNPELVIVFGADHVYRMDVQQMLDFHLTRQAEVTVAALPVPLREASAFGVIATDADKRVREFQEKPDNPSPMPTDSDHAYASMGNYIFNADLLIKALKTAHEQGGTDFGHDILPTLLNEHRVYAYDFATNTIPGVEPYEEASYWRDVGTLDAYFSANQDLLGSKPQFDMFNPEWPIYSSNYQGPASRMMDAAISNSIIAGGSTLLNARVRNSIIRREVVLEEEVDIEDCIIMDYVRIKRGARLRRAIVGRYNRIEAGTRIGYDPDADAHHHHVSPAGIVVVAPGEISSTMRAFSETD